MDQQARVEKLVVAFGHAHVAVGAQAAIVKVGLALAEAALDKHELAIDLGLDALVLLIVGGVRHTLELGWWCEVICHFLVFIF